MKFARKKLLEWARYYNKHPEHLKGLGKSPFKGAGKEAEIHTKGMDDLLKAGYSRSEAEEIIEFAKNVNDYHGGFKTGKQGLGGEQINSGSIKRNSEKGKKIKSKVRKRFVRQHPAEIGAAVGAAGTTAYLLSGDDDEKRS